MRPSGVLFNSKEDEIEKLIKCHQEMKWFLIKYNEKLSRKMFSEFMEIILFHKDPLFTENIFLLFDEDNDDIIDIKELIIGLELFREDTFFSKMDSII